MRASTRKKIEKTYLAQQAKAEAKAKAKAKAKSKKPATKTVSWDKADSINNEQVVPSNFRNAVVLTMDGEDARDETPLGVKYPDRAFPQSDVVENEREETARDDAITKASSLDINQNFSALGASDILNNMQDAASDQVGIADTRQPRSQSKPKADDVSHRATKENSTLARAKQGIKSEQGGTHAGGLRYGHSKSKKTTEANKIREGENFQDSIVSTSMEEDMSGEREGCQQRKDTNQEMIHTVREAVARRTRTKVKNLSPGNDFSRNRNKGNQRCKGFFGKRKSQSKRGHAARELGLASEKAKREKEQNEQEVEILATLTMKSEEEESPNSVELADKEGKVDSKDDSENPPALSSNKESSSIAGGGPLADCFLHMMPEVDWLKMFFGGVHTATKRGSPAEATTVPVGVAEGQEPTLAKSSPFFPRQSPQSGTHAVSVKTNNNRQGRRTSDTRPAPRSPSPGTARRRKSPARKASPSRKQEVASTRGRSPSQRSKRPSPSAKDKSTSRLESGSRSDKRDSSRSARRTRMASSSPAESSLKNRTSPSTKSTLPRSRSPSRRTRQRNSPVRKERARGGSRSEFSDRNLETTTSIERSNSYDGSSRSFSPKRKSTTPASRERSNKQRLSSPKRHVKFLPPTRSKTGGNSESVRRAYSPRRKNRKPYS